MPPPPSEPEGRARSICLWLTTFLFFVSILAGGTFLVLYILLPTSDYNFWFPIAGIALIGIPWAFWIFTCIYRSVHQNLNKIPMARVQRIASLATSNNSTRNGFRTSIDSPGRPRRVRFADVLESHKEEEDEGENGGEMEERGDFHAMCTDGPSRISCESERPLALSMVS